MKVSLLLVIITTLNVSASLSQDLKFNLNVDNVPLSEVIRAIEQQSSYRFFYSDNYRELNDLVSINIKGGEVKQILSELLQKKSLSFRLMEGNVIIIAPSKAFQKHTVTGKVTDATTGEVLPGVNVLVEGTTMGVVTDMDGKYSIDVPSEDAALVFSFVGYVSDKRIVSQNSVIDITLIPDIKSLEEVVVVGYGVQKKVNLTGAVEQVSSEALENRSMTNLSQGLQGIVPNLNITLKDGKPTQSPSFNIRGTTSIGQGGSALVLIDGVEGNPALLNPNDVASVTVLKDASSASIYGARGVFGVVLITTKKPTANKTSITYSASYSIKSPTSVPDEVTDGYQWASMFNEAFSAWNDYASTPQNVNKTLKFSQEYLTELQKRSLDPSLPKVDVNPTTGEYTYYSSTNWYKELYKDHFGAMDHNLSISGGNDKTTFYLTGRYFNQDGLFRYNSDDYKMYNMRAKGSTQLLSWLNVEDNFEYSEMLYHNPLNVGEGGGIWRNLADEGHPMAPMFNPDGTLTYSAAYTVGDFWYGKNGIDTDKRTFKNTTSFTAKFLQDKLRVKGDFTFQDYNQVEERRRVQVPYSRYQGVINYVGSGYNDLYKYSRNTKYISANIYTEYETLLANSHYIKAMVGYNYEQSTRNAYSATRNGLLDSNTENFELATGQTFDISGDWEKWKILGGFFRLNYVFKERYLLEVNGRYDGSSKFPSYERYAFFPSFSAGWRISKESFWNIPENAISDLKLRASYGSLGNGNINSYRFMELLSLSQSGRVLNGVKPQYTSKPGVIPNGLTWETATTENIGLDFAALSNRLKFSFDAYTRKTTDMFTKGPTLPAVFGADVPDGNYADLRTNGWEFSLGWSDNFNLATKPFSYDVRVTLADYKSKILKFNNSEKKLDDYYEGQTLGEVWGYETEGLFQSDQDILDHADQKLIKASNSGKLLPGDVKFKDQNDDHVIDYGTNTVADHGDLKIIGNTTPRYTYGFNLGAGWNNIFFSAFFQGVGKQDWWPGIECDRFWGQYNRPYNDPLKSQLGNIWSEDNPNAYFPRYRGYVAGNTSRELGVKQTRYLQNVAYVRLKNIQLGYDLPKELISKIKLTNARIYVSADNIWTWSPMYRITENDIDVESIGQSDADLTSEDKGNGNNYPIIKSVSFGISLTL
ncbi:MAG TPA: TonB-dependent receptor [Bacteroidales bacterium]|nr:TonB-dependent receptor [Bacteroidales bacterium]